VGIEISLIRFDLSHKSIQYSNNLINTRFYIQSILECSEESLVRDRRNSTIKQKVRREAVWTWRISTARPTVIIRVTGEIG